MEILVESKQELIWCPLKEGDAYVIITETDQVPDEHVQLVREAKISHLLLNMFCNMECGILQEVKLYTKKSLKLCTCLFFILNTDCKNIYHNFFKELIKKM